MRYTFLFLFVSLFLATSCTKAQPKNKAEPVVPHDGKISIADGWIREGKAGMMSAAYFTIRNGTGKADTLWSISAEDVSEDVQIHESYKTDDGLMGMKPVGAVPVPADDAVELKPGGIHIMIIQPYSDLNDGDQVRFELNFNSGDIVIELPVKKVN